MGRPLNEALYVIICFMVGTENTSGIKRREGAEERRNRHHIWLKPRHGTSLVVI